MTTTLPAVTGNYSLLAIPAYMVIAMGPHAYSVYLIMSNNNKKWDNASPRSTQNRSNSESSVPKECYRKFERCRAAHDNMMENMAFVVGGILSGVIMKLDPKWMNLMVGAYLVTRMLYAISYVQTASQKWSWLRTIWYMGGSLIIMAFYWEAGMALAKQGLS